MSSLLFIEIRWLDIIDILLVALLIFQLYQLVRGTVAIKIFIGILSIYILWKLVEFLKMDMLGEILGQFIGVGVIALLIVFQQELRRFLLVIGNSRVFDSGKQGFVSRLFGTEQKTVTDIEMLINACTRMSETRTGALIIVAKTSDPSTYTLSGIEIDAKLSDRLLESIFNKESPLHDGAVIVRENRITHARCVLPVTENPKFPDALGMRHRAAVGISEVCDALVIVVSEQTGKLALAKQGSLKTNIAPEELQGWLKRMLK